MDYKKLGVYAVFAFLMLSLTLGVVSAADNQIRGLDATIQGPDWWVNFVKFFGFGETWSLVIVSLAIVVMIMAATYDILSFTAFESKWVKLLISIGIALVVAVARGIAALAALLMAIVGGSVIIGTFVAIILAIIFFVIAGFFKGKAKAWKMKQTAAQAEGAFELSRAATVGKIREAKAAAKAAG